MIDYCKTASGLIVATDTMPGVESVTIGVYVAAGSRDEAVMGTAHFLEHMAFQGTTTRTAQQIQGTIENVGGVMNAATTYEYTVYYVKVLKENWQLGLDILADILQNPTFPAEQLERERGVILQEIAMYADSPEDVATEALQALQYRDHPLGRPILGSPEAVRAMRAADLQDMMTKGYHTGTMLVAAAGAIDPQQFGDYAGEVFAGLPARSAPKRSPAQPVGGEQVAVRGDLQQTSIAMGWRGVHRTDPLYLPACLWSGIVGEGVMSRLYQEIREKRGLVYDVESYISAFSDGGTFNVVAGTAPAHKDQVIEVCRDILRREDFAAADLNRVKTGLIAGSRMMQESSISRMERLAQNLFVYGRVIPLTEYIQWVENVTLDDIISAKRQIIRDDTFALSVVGPSS